MFYSFICVNYFSDNLASYEIEISIPNKVVEKRFDSLNFLEDDTSDGQALNIQKYDLAINSKYLGKNYTEG